MAEAIITRRGGVGFPEGWNESVSAPAFGSITKHAPVMLRVFCEWGGEEVKLSNPSTLPAGEGTDCAFSPDGVYLAVAHYGSPFVTIFNAADTYDVIQQMTSRSMFLLTGKHGLSLTTANDGETARAIVFPSVYNLPREEG